MSCDPSTRDLAEELVASLSRLLDDCPMGNVLPGERRLRMRERYETPAVVDFGSIADHTFTRCGGTGKPGHANVPPKDFPWVPHHIDGHGECSAPGPFVIIPS